MAAVRSAKQFLTYVASGPFQYAVAEALALPDSCFADFREDMRVKRDLLAVGLADAGFYDHRGAGAPFVRFAFCKQTAVLKEAVSRLESPTA